jgi:anti-sigma B factor antagonist
MLLRSGELGIDAVISGHPYLTIEVERAQQAHTIVLSGEADLQSSPRIEAAIENASSNQAGLVVVDLRRLTFIDSTGLHAFANGHELCRARGQELRMIPGPAHVQRIFELTGMDEVLPFCDPEVAGEPAPGDET